MKIRDGMMVWGLCCLFSCGVAFSVSTADMSTKIEEGKLFTVEKEVSLPEAAYPALKVYLETLFFSRPLPWPYHLEKFDVRGGKVVLQGRVLSPGKYEIPLGVFWWNGKRYVLPSFSCSSTPVHIQPLMITDLLLPFPDEVLLPSVQNVQMESVLLMHNQEAGSRLLHWRDFWRHAFVMACLFLVCFPCALQLWRMWQVKRKPEGVVPIDTPGTVFREVKDLRKRKETPWPKLIYVLNLVASAEIPSLTSYELEQRFTTTGEKELAEAAASIENYSYRPEGGQYFDQTVALVERGLTEKKLL